MYVHHDSMLCVTIYRAEGACRAGNHVGGSLWAVRPCRAAASCWALLWLRRNRTADAEVTRGREMMRTGMIGRAMWDVGSDRRERPKERQSIRDV